MSEESKKVPMALSINAKRKVGGGYTPAQLQKRVNEVLVQSNADGFIGALFNRKEETFYQLELSVNTINASEYLGSLVFSMVLKDRDASDIIGCDSRKREIFERIDEMYQMLMSDERDEDI